jgi:hypothetical protein
MPTGLKKEETIRLIVQKLEAGKGKTLEENIKIIIDAIYQDLQTNAFVTVDGNPVNIK